MAPLKPNLLRPTRLIATGRRPVLWIAVIVPLLCAFLSSPLHAQGASAELPIELRPYRVLITIAFGSEARLTPGLRQDVLGGVSAAAGRSVGAMWQTELHENDWLLPANRTGLSRLLQDAATERFEPTEFDKVFIVTIESAGARYRAAGREWDRTARELGPVQSVEIPDRRAIPHEVYALVNTLFRPVAAIGEEDLDSDRIAVRVQAGEFPAIDPAVAQLQGGDLLQPLLRYLDRTGVLRRIQFVPWSYLVVDETERGRAWCTQASGVRTPFGGQQRRLVETSALRIRPAWEATRLQLLPASGSAPPLAGQRVSVLPRLPQPDDPRPESINLLTDRRGEIRLPVDAEQPLVWLYVRSGELLLARVPFVPGMVPQTSLQLPDDSLRLDVEGKIELLRGKLVDTVAQRAVLIARARLLAQSSRWEDVDAQVDRLEKLPGIRDFELQLTTIRVPAVEEAKKRGDRAAEARIQRLSRDASELIRKHLDPENIYALKTDLSQLREFERQAPRR
jgi:hypothetical protein